MVFGQYRTKPRVWALAVLSTLMLHIGVVVAGRLLRPFDPSSAYARESGIIEVVFTPEPDRPSDGPTFFTELPPDRAGERPERPDFLSNVDSRASDNVPGGADEGLPFSDGSSESPHVLMEAGAEKAVQADAEPDDLPSPQEDAEPPIEQLPPEEEPGVSPQMEDAGAEPREMAAPSFLSRQSKAHLTDPLRDFRREMFGSDPNDPSRTRNGADDISQDAMSNREGNALPSGDISLNTVAWDYAPWLQRFSRDLQRRWLAPYGYYLGAIHGYTLVELEITHGGDLIRMDILEEQGHEALKNASVAALRGAMPYQPLPDHFPLDTLILRVKLIYPERKS